MASNTPSRATPAAQSWGLAPDDLLRDPVYRRLWISVLCSSVGAQVTILALPLTAALLLRASPVEMGLLTAAELVPYALFSLPAGVLLDRVRKLPVYIAGELGVASAVMLVPLCWWLDWLAMPLLYVVGFVVGVVNVLADTGISEAKRQVELSKPFWR